MNDGHSLTNFSEFKFPDEPLLTMGDLMQAEKEKKLVVENLHFSKEKAPRNSLFFRHESETNLENCPAANLVLDEDFYKITDRDVKTIYRCLKDEARCLTERGFISKEIVDQNNLKSKMEAYIHTTVRFSFHRQVFVQANFFSTEPVSRLFEFIQELLIEKSLHFTLRIPPSLSVENTENMNLLDLNIAPKSIVYLRFPDLDGNPYMFEEIFDVQKMVNSTQLEGDAIIDQWLSVNTVFRTFRPTLPAASTKGDQDQSILSRVLGKKPTSKNPDSETSRPKYEVGRGDDDGSKGSGSTVPKWFKKPKMNH